MQVPKLFKDTFTGMSLLIAAVLFVVLSLQALFQYGTIETDTAYVTATERVCSNKNDECVWMVLTDKGSFENKDALLHFKFNSTDVQGKIKENYTYKFTHYGWRIPFLSIYENIVGLEEIEEVKFTGSN